MSAVRTSTITKLQDLQRDVTRGQLADSERKKLVFRLWTQGRSQSYIAELLTAGSLDEGGPVITENVVYKIIKSMKRASA